MCKKFFLLTMVMVLSVVLSGCGQSYTEKKIENAMEEGMGQNVDVDLDSGQVNIQAEDGSSIQAGEGVSLPEDFPEDVYVVDGQIVAAMKNVMGAGYQVTVKTSKSFQDVAELYQEKLSQDGWEVNQSMALGEMLMLSANKSDKTVSVSISENEEGVDVMVIITVVSDEE